ncbi:NAD(P)-binding protein [Aaosphaeria arxii CBS 175.79]|uniref:NAD(P)-binding protein n=1 Tax=Aaosphaeria arxii CBS 175.79 TaxID=1450172 RepID=A0A6A5XNC0_9PLEO|nr:NAD(P)-binding protein [Aaosphaeria arxii CBS 175.79]KAF2014271.1 NAD(P)-binding protein [Aaosphaeria arxii CBS 175.79]
MFRNLLISGAKFRPDRDIPSLHGKVILVTGGNSGLGLESVRQLVQHRPSRIFLAARSKEKAEIAIKDLSKSCSDTSIISPLVLDLASSRSIKSAVSSFTEQSSRLDLLINNAGIMMTPEGLTEDGYEIQFGTNHMGHALLIQLLLPSLQNTAETNPDVRVITLSSATESYAPKKGIYDLPALKTTMSNLSTQTRYAISKLANIHYNTALSKRYSDIKFIAVHPGSVNTNLAGSILQTASLPLKLFFHIWALLFVVPPEQGALNQLWASTSKDAKSGEFYHPVGVPGKGSQLSASQELSDQLWEWTQNEIRAYH